MASGDESDFNVDEPDVPLPYVPKNPNPPNPPKAKSDPSTTSSDQTDASSDNRSEHAKAENANANASHPNAQSTGGIERFLYNHNPFYCVSVALVLLAAAQFGTNQITDDPFQLASSSWILLGCLAVYCLILAGIGVAIIRVGSIWDDARTILISLLLLFVGMSVVFDRLILRQPQQAIVLLLCGFCFSILVTQLVLSGISLRFSWYYRLPLFLMLALLFLYPVGVMTLFEQVGLHANNWVRNTLPWVLFSFPFASALVILTLLPAAYAGDLPTRSNGSPWRWPVYPWSVFVIMLIALMIRAYMVVISFDPRPTTQSIFGSYFLTPMLAAAALVLFEIGRKAKSNAAMWWALLASLLPIALCLSPSGDWSHKHAAHSWFLAEYTQRFWAPVWLAWALSALLALYAYGRKMPGASTVVVLLIAFGSMLKPDTLDLQSFRTMPNPVMGYPAVIAVVLFLLRMKYPSAKWCSLVVFAGVALHLSPLPRSVMVGDISIGLIWLILAGCFVTSVIIGALLEDDFADGLFGFASLVMFLGTIFLTMLLQLSIGNDRMMGSHTMKLHFLLYGVQWSMAVLLLLLACVSKRREVFDNGKMHAIVSYLFPIRYTLYAIYFLEQRNAIYLSLASLAFLAIGVLVSRRKIAKRKKEKAIPLEPLPD